ncbi:MAG TPA: phosphoribosylformylglycinamidine synthase, partial [Planctomycetaceae bacterium]|nr:phosphoribosylformylglycinamidine synthase [Planctomycetaceae bacterium]
RYEDRWVHLEVCGDRCVFLRGVKRLYLPIAHAEGKFVARDEKTLTRLDAEGRLALRYALPEAGDKNVARSENGKPLPFPVNPNGSQADTAGCCDATGRVFGLMPHPERHIDALQHPRWTRGEGNPEQQGTALFVNAVEHFR